MNDRQKALINFLKQQDGYVKQDIIARKVPYYRNHGNFFKSFHNTTARVRMTNDIRKINNSDEFDGIIISDPNGVKIATKEECQRKLMSEYICNLKALKRTMRKLFKLGLDGQAFITDELTEDFKDVFNKGA